MKLEVYKITNKSNGKLYIGITNQGVAVRFGKHVSDANGNSTFPIHNAIRKYSIENFEIETVEVVDNVELLKQREIYWINFYDSYNREKGYNLTLGGDGTFGRYHSEETKCKIRNKLLGKHHTADTILKFRKRKDKIKPVLQYSLEGVFIKEYYSVAEAARELKVNRCIISACARGYRKRVYGFVWKYKN